MSIDVSISGLNTEVDVTRESSANVDPTLLLALRGEKGDSGTNGTNGADGVGISSITFNGDYTMTIGLDDGTSYTSGNIRGQAGQDGTNGTDGTNGVGISSIVFNNDYTMTITLTDGTTYTSGNIRGATGQSGTNGTNGSDGVGISSIVFNNDYTMTITLTDGTTTTSSSLRGSTGATGNGIMSIYKTGEDGRKKTYTILYDDATTTTFDVMDGADGTNGTNGQDGNAATIAVGSVTTGAAGTSASVTNSGTSTAAVFDFTIPKGDKGDTGSKGDTGDAGSAATIAVGTVTTGDAGTSASVVNSGTSSAAVFDFTIPKGDKGSKGDTGATGSAATVAVGTVTTGAAGSSASVVNSGTSSAAVFDFTIPRGDTGDLGTLSGTDPITYSSNTIGFDNTNTDYQSGSQVSSAISSAISGKQDTLTEGDGIDITSNVISNTQGIEYIVGTQASATNAWTGVSKDTSLKTGKIIAYKLPYAGNSTAATLNLTMADGTTTGAIALRRVGTGTVTTHFAVDNVIILVYDGTYWRVSAYYDSNSNYYDRMVWSNVKLTAGAASGRYSLGFVGSDGKFYGFAQTSGTGTAKTLNTGVKFEPSRIFYQLTATYAANAEIAASACYSRYQAVDIRYSCNQGSWMTAQKPVYLIMHLENDGYFTLGSTIFTQTLPTTADGLYYKPVGISYSTYQMVFEPRDEILYHDGTKLQHYGFSAHTHTKSEITDFPTLATVATSGDYGDLSNTPSIPTVTDTYSGTSSDGMSGKAVKSAIDALDGSVTGTAGAGKTLTAFSQTDGVVSATFGNISITKSQVSDFPTIPTKTSDLTNDSGFLTSETKANWTEADSTSSAYIENKPAISSGAGTSAILESGATAASGSYSHAEGYLSTASGDYGAHAEGDCTTASGDSSHSEGSATIASGTASHAGGWGTCADQNYQTAIGRFNTENNTNNLFVVGNGSLNDSRSDAFTVDSSGNAVASGDITSSGDVIDSNGFALGWRKIGTASSTERTYTLPSEGTYLLVTGHNSTASLNCMWLVRTSGNASYRLSTTSPTVTVTVSGTTLTLKTSSGTADVFIQRLY